MDEPKSIQQKLAGILTELEKNGELSQELAADLPAVIAAIPDGPTFDLCVTTMRSFRQMWKHHPDCEVFWLTLSTLFERDAVRRGLMQGHEIGSLERIAEL